MASRSNKRSALAHKWMFLMNGFVCGTTHVMGIRENHPSCTVAEKIAASFH